MLKQAEGFDTQELERSDTLEKLPPLPEGVVVPDDLRHLGIDQRPRRLVRWGWFTAVVAILAAASVFTIIQLSNDSVDEIAAPALTEAPAYDLKQQAIDDRVAWIEQLPDVKEFYVGIYERRMDARVPVEVLPYDLKQQAMDEGIARIEQRPDVKEFYVDLYQERLDKQSG